MREAIRYCLKTLRAQGYTILLLVSLLGCDNFLDEVPDNRVALDDLDRASQLLTNAYSLASPAFTDWMSDDVLWTRGTTKRTNHEQLYSWEDNTSDPTEQDSPIYFWFQTYDAIAHANEVLAVIDDLPATTDKEKAQKQAVEGEALLARAYGHFMLVNIFGQHFNFQTSGSDLGIPYVTTPETSFIATYSRLSVKRVYDKIEDDMLAGIELIDDSFYANSGKYHFNRNAALAFASRFYLFKGDFIRCIDYSSQMLGADPSTYVRDITSTEFQEAKSSIQGYPQLYSSPDLPSNLMLMRKISLVQRTDFAFGPTDDVYNEIFGPRFPGTVDERENPALVKGENALYPLRYQSLFERSSLNSNTGFPYHISVPFRGEEVLLNRAEAHVFQNDLGLALADLQVLNDKRYSGVQIQLTVDLIRNTFFGPDSANYSDQDVVLIYIIFLERRKEFVAQGMRWFDIKRYRLEVIHDYVNGATFRLEAEDLRKAIQIPKSAIDVGGLEENPR